MSLDMLLPVGWALWKPRGQPKAITSYVFLGFLDTTLTLYQLWQLLHPLSVEERPRWNTAQSRRDILSCTKPQELCSNNPEGLGMNWTFPPPSPDEQQRQNMLNPFRGWQCPQGSTCSPELQEQSWLGQAAFRPRPFHAPSSSWREPVIYRKAMWVLLDQSLPWKPLPFQ